MLQRIREGLTLILIVVLPFHAFLVTVGTKMIAGPGHSPLPMLALWKEALLGLILIIAIAEWARKLRIENGELRMDRIDLCIGVLLFWSLIQAFILNSPFSILHYAFGFKYDFLPLVAFLILRRVPWSDQFRRTAVAVLLGVGVIVVLYGLATLFLPMSWFTALGYSDLHSLYVPGGPLAPFQQIEAIGIRRMQSTFSGPNQLGIWLLVPLCILLSGFLGEEGRKGARTKGADCALVPLVLVPFAIAIALTFSRSAWIAAAVIGAVVAWKHLSQKKLLLVSCSLFAVAVIAAIAFPSVIIRTASSGGHIERPLQALHIMKAHPFGLGLGTAGPASNRFSDTCVELPTGADVSWAQPHEKLCVFVGGIQVQPTDRPCSCPLLPENWYLQIGVELGWIGFVLYIVLVFILLKRLFELRIENLELRIHSSILNSQFSIALAFFGISIAALFLHAWEDSAVALTVWMLVAAVHPCNTFQKTHH
ncbi:hypothetical protein A3G69_05820 [Candidatus Peribacteria bacterium RIFCSPLOWO2_12_FULL_53_10]|nr:MAG: hypothetical protein A3B61_00140 [Candidatus Peribacteria bacterium RIFCSPLOWO2_01_FULL_53_10]OGJ69821.1 MAG: hypothetical protein A3G69_05820 [Candidatus Peribacteria bacterium RIFCSPLOWO2_12_FULL_53_10]